MGGTKGLQQAGNGRASPLATRPSCTCTKHTHTHSVVQSQAWEGLSNVFQTNPSFPYALPRPGTPGALMLCFLASWGSSQVPSGAAKEKQGMEG